ncbi:MAG: hypothetical protein RL113_280, partial [Pseudomonadota bacterium]
NDALAGYIGVDGLYTSMWMQFAGNDVGSSYKVAASTDINGVSTSVAYADFDEAGKEFDLILGYSYTDAISFDAIFTNTNYAEDEEDDKAFEFIATYKF